MWFGFKINGIYLYNLISSQNWNGPGAWNHSFWTTKTALSSIVNILAVDGLANKGASHPHTWYWRNSFGIFRPHPLTGWCMCSVLGFLYVLIYLLMNILRMVTCECRPAVSAEWQSHSEWQGCSLNGRGAVMHDEMSIKAGAHWLTGVALLSVARWHCLVFPEGGAKPLI